MRIVDSARKHGISDKDVEFVYKNSITSMTSQEEPVIIMLFGFDTIGRGIEVAYVANDDGNDIVIHAMKIRPQYKHHLYGNKGSV